MSQSASLRGGIALALALALVAHATVAATLDVAEDGADLIFTWDSGAAEDLVRGTTPDDLQPWLVSVSSPLRVPSENVMRAEDTYYRLASGSNIAFRLELVFDVPDPARPTVYAVTLPERHAFVTAFELLQGWPTLGEVIWFDGTQRRFESATRAPDGIPIGDDEPIPRHGGVWLEFGATTTIAFVGSTDEAYAGVVAADVSTGNVALGVPPDSRRLTAVSILCGDPGIDWFDVNGDGVPDECGTDNDGDTLSDTGLFRGPSVTLRDYWTVPAQSLTVRRSVFSGDDSFTGAIDLGLRPGRAFLISPESPDANFPFRPPRW